MKLVGILSRSILRIPDLAVFLQPWGMPVALGDRQTRGDELAAIAGWGYKPSADAARAEAARRGLGYLALEDGFLRSVGLGVAGASTWSIVVDDLGIYYDAAAPSRLERMIGAGEPPGADTMTLLGLLRDHRLSKYNDAPDVTSSAGRADGAPLVIVVDQTVGDASVAAGGADTETFSVMLEAALRENAGAHVVVRSHPDVAAGKRRGYLTEIARRRGVPVDTRRVSWPSLARLAARIYTATSLAGLEALVTGVPVACFGQPFYAGWGLTDDRLPCQRRRERPSLEMLVAAAYQRYTRYVDPVHRRATDAITVAHRLAAARRRDADTDAAGRLFVLGVSRWKRRFVQPFVASGRGTLIFAAPSRRTLARCARSGGRALVWSAREPEWLPAAAARVGVQLGRIEDGFLRSVGLGSNFVAALSLVIDDLGIYFDPRQPSRLERILDETEFPSGLLLQARTLRQRLVAGGYTKYNLSGARRPPVAVAPGVPVILVPGQVEDDMSIRRGAPDVHTNLALLAAVRAAAPGAVILYKPHPDVESGNRIGAVPDAEARRLADAVIAGWDAAAALDLAAEVHTMTSLLGFEGLLRGRRVVTYGLPFYAGLGLTTDRLAWPRPRRPVDLDGLVAAALLLYARYVDPATDLPVTALDVVEILERMRESGQPPPGSTARYRRWLQLVFGG